MKLCFSTIGCPEWDFSDILATAGDLGYQGFEVRGVGRDLYAPEIPQFAGAELSKTRELLAQKKLSIPCLATDNVLHLTAYRDRTIKEVTAYIELAKALGVPYIRVMGDNPQPWPGAPVDVACVEGMLLELAPIAEAAGVTLLVETNGYFCDTAHLAKLLDKVNHPGVAALWDVHHPFRYKNEAPATTWQNIGKWVRHTHWKDSVLTDRVRYAMMGHGDLPLAEMVRVLKDGGYDGFYSLEWTRRWDLTLEMPGIVFAHYVSYMKSFA